MESSGKNVMKGFGGVRKLMDTSNSFHHSMNTSASLNLSSRTPHQSKTPNENKHNKSGSKRVKTPVADRFMADRGNFEMAHYLLQSSDASKNKGDDTSGNATGNESKKDSFYSRSLTESVLGVPDLNGVRVLSFAQKPKCAPDGYQNVLKVVYQGTGGGQVPLTKHRVLPKSPERVLDAPDVVDDFYLNLLAWSKTNVVAIALREQVYLWTAHTAEITRIPCDGNEPIEMVTSVCYLQDGSHLVCGLDNGKIQVWDIEKVKIVRTLRTADAGERIPAVHVNTHLLTQGNRLGTLRHHDLRIAEHEICTHTQAHQQEICGIRWSPDARFYATGGNDNVVQVWDSLNMGNSMQPMYTFSDHIAAIKAMCWSPSHSNVLATGGGTNDRTIKIWNVSSGNLLRSTDTESQVSGLIWHDNYREILSSHGYSKNQLSLWNYPEMSKGGEMLGHSSRILHVALSPDETTVATVGADETLRFWRIFPVTKSSHDLQKQKQKTSVLTSGFTSLR